MLLANDPAKDKAAAFLWPFMAAMWNYAADRIGEVAGDAVSIDRAMQAGFNWELGPFELWDAAGVKSTVARMKALGLPVSARVEALLNSAPDAADVPWYSTGRAAVFQPGDRRFGDDYEHARPRTGCGFQASAWGGEDQSRRVAGGFGRWDRMH